MHEDTPQREIERLTGLSRPYLRRLAKQIGHQFPRNGVEICGRLCLCVNCGCLFRRPKSKVTRALNTFCSKACKNAWMRGANHPNWDGGKTSNTFSSWVYNQAPYKAFRKAVLERDNYQCVFTGRKDNLDVHHILPKAEDTNPEKVFDINNGITICKEVHQRIHALIREGHEFEEALSLVRQEFQQEQEDNG
ncbi:MAG: HNH endonuclease signature motif containing protein [Clostridia bacterium]